MSDDGFVLECRDLTLTLRQRSGKLKIVEDFNLNIKRGEFCALIGESGSGKTMIARAILRLIAPSRMGISGTLRVCGVDVAGARESRMRELRCSKIGMIFQEPMTSLNPIMPIGKQIAEKIRKHRRLSSTQLREEVEKLLSSAQLKNIDHIKTMYPHELSGGMRQRVMIAIALANQPDLLVADEPTTALDVTTQKEIVDIIKAQQRDSGLAVLYISHDLALVSRYADHIGVLYAGVLMEHGPADLVIGSPSHPYTKALLNCVPRPRTADERKKEIKGTVARVDNWFPGCRFAPRCEQSRAECCEHPIDVIQESHSRAVKCLYPQN